MPGKAPNIDIDEEQRLRALALEIEARLASYADPALARRRLVSLLRKPDDNASGSRLTLRAQKVAQQGGRCGACALPFTEMRKPSMHLTVSDPIVCKPCQRIALLARVGRAPG